MTILQPKFIAYETVNNYVDMWLFRKEIVSKEKGMQPGPKWFLFFTVIFLVTLSIFTLALGVVCPFQVLQNRIFSSSSGLIFYIFWGGGL
jgi:hypothetical protein